jgi:hypothetical protein
LALPSEARESIVVLDDSLVRVMGMQAHLTVVLCDLVLEHRALLL